MIKIAISLILFLSIFDYYRLNLIKEQMSEVKNENVLSKEKQSINNNSLIDIEVQYCSS